MTGRGKGGKVLEILGTVNVAPVDIISTNEGAIILLENEDLQDAFSPDNLHTIQEAGISLAPPPEYHADRTVFVRRLSQWIGENSHEDIVDSINRSNPGMTAIFARKIKTEGNDRFTLKITFETPEQAKQATEKGFRCFGLSTPAYQVKKERYFHLRQCFRCFKFDHFANKCTEATRTCSICSGNHIYTECDQDTKKCALCGDEHIAISSKCPRRKEEETKIKEKSKPKVAAAFNINTAAFPSLPNASPLQNAQTQQPPAWSTGTPPIQQTTPTTTPPKTKQNVQIPVLIAIAEKIAKDDIDIFIKTINRLLVANDLPAVKVPVDIVTSPAVPSTQESPPCQEPPLQEPSTQESSTQTQEPPRQITPTQEPLIQEPSLQAPPNQEPIQNMKTQHLQMAETCRHSSEDSDFFIHQKLFNCKYAIHHRDTPAAIYNGTYDSQATAEAIYKSHSYHLRKKLHEFKGRPLNQNHLTGHEAINIDTTKYLNEEEYQVSYFGAWLTALSEEDQLAYSGANKKRTIYRRIK